MIGVAIWAGITLAVLLPLPSLHHQNLLGWSADALFGLLAPLIGQGRLIKGIIELLVIAAFLVGTGVLTAGLARILTRDENSD